MHSIDANQPEQNHKDLSGAEAIAKLQELVKKAPTCFFCTRIRSGGPFATRPMSVQKVDADGTIWFLSPKDSAKNRELTEDAHIQLLFQGSAHSDFLTLFGSGHVSFDRSKIEELWEPILKTWFTEGKDDARISVIRVVPERGYYWDTKHNRAIVFAKMVAGALTGKTLDDSIEGALRL